MRKGLFVIVLGAAVLGLGACSVGHHRYIRPEPGIYRHADVDQMVDRYILEMNYAIGLTQRQERQIRRLLADRIEAWYYGMRRGRYDSADPLPRTYAKGRHAAYRRWWSRTDSEVERLLRREQRRDYRAWTRAFRQPGRRSNP